jgi:hypothetical protein
MEWWLPMASLVVGVILGGGNAMLAYRGELMRLSSLLARATHGRNEAFAALLLAHTTLRERLYGSEPEALQIEMMECTLEVAGRVLREGSVMLAAEEVKH